MSRSLLSVVNLSKRFSRGGRSFAAVDDVSFEVMPGEILALCGPSGSGKSTVARLVMRLLLPDAGMIAFGGSDLARLHGNQLRLKRHRFQMVFQNTTASFNPRATVRRAMEDPLRVSGAADKATRPGLIGELLDRVGLSAAIADRAIHEISGGQRQRVAIARALATNPSLIVLDEALSAIDASIRGDILRLLLELRDERNLTYLFISHDLAVIRAIADRVAIMHQGRIVETGPALDVVQAPQSGIGKTLIAATPQLPTGGVARP